MFFYLYKLEVIEIYYKIRKVNNIQMLKIILFLNTYK